ncbi:MAG: hypothetical protein ABWZ03_04690, partial [Solirubrobacterales bacterium]
MPTLSRRGLLAIGGAGAAGALLSACGESVDPRAAGDDEALVSAEASAEASLAAAYSNAASAFGPGEERTALEQFSDA